MLKFAACVQKNNPYFSLAIPQSLGRWFPGFIFPPNAQYHPTDLRYLPKMAYYFNRQINDSFDSVVERTIQALKAEGFGVVTEMNVHEKINTALGIEFRPYKIMGACNPAFAHKALQIEDKIGTMLPCNVIVQEWETGKTEVAIINPSESMQAVQNPDLAQIASQVKAMLERVLASI